MDWNKIRRIFGMQEYCPECGLEIPYKPWPMDARMIASEGWTQCGSCGGAKKVPDTEVGGE